MSMIIEGINGIGKTTFCQELLKLPRFKDYKYLHLTAHEDNTYSYYKNLLKDDKLVLDRGALGELVYSSIYGRKPRITLSEVNKLFKEVNCYVLWTNDLDKIVKNLTSKGEQGSDEYDLQWIRNEQQLFWKYIKRLKNVNIIPYNYQFIRRYCEVVRG